MADVQLVSPKVLEKFEQSIPNSEKPHLKEPSRWLTLEFFGHYVMIGQAVYFGLRSVFNISSISHPAYRKYSAFLSPGWIPNRSIDLSDGQYGSFRKNVHYLALLMAVYLAMSYFIRKSNGDITLRCFLGMIFIFLLHGFNIVKLMAIAGVNYLIAKSKYENYRMASLWAWALIVLFVTEWFEFPLFPRSLFTGFYPRWNIVFKITVLRMISFGMDYHWFSQFQSYNEGGQLHRQSCKRCSEIGECEKFQSQYGCKEHTDFDWPQYLAYLFYPPLYLAGPILTFNSFTSQLRLPRINRKHLMHYAGRFVACFLFLDVLLHFCHVVAVKESKAFDSFTAIDYGMLGFFNLKIIWLKLLVIWRFFRTASLVDGISPPENMLRCMSNNYSGLAFWRSWHRSFYLWILQYIYIPLGGSKTFIWSMWPVFMFVAVWHDLRLHLLAWSWLICLFLLPEILARWLKTRLRMEEWSNYRYIAGLAGTISICMMITANLVGFAVGIDGVKMLWKSIVTVKGAFFLLNALCTAYSATQIMFEIRAEERRNGIYKNY